MGTPLLTPDFSLVLGGPLYQLTLTMFSLEALLSRLLRLAF